MFKSEDSGCAGSNISILKRLRVPFFSEGRGALLYGGRSQDLARSGPLNLSLPPCPQREGRTQAFVLRKRKKKGILELSLTMLGLPWWSRG